MPTKIEWCDETWSPVTGCLHGCEYCYARKQVKRFMGYHTQDSNNKHGFPNLTMHKDETRELHDLHERMWIMRGKTLKTQLVKAPYPFGFDPTFHRYRLDEPQKLKKPSNIFVCSMADLFGEWVPDKWVQEVFKACEAAPRHRYLFLTKNPGRYIKLAEKRLLPEESNYWYGSTATGEYEPIMWSDRHNTFASMEPLLSPFSDSDTNALKCGWIITGAETGHRKGKIIPKREWIENIAIQCRAANVPVFMEKSLAGIWGGELIQEWPW